MSDLYQGFKSVASAVSAVIKGETMKNNGNKALVSFAFIKGELPSPEIMKQRDDFSSLNTLKVLGAHCPENIRESECEALLASLDGTKDKITLGNFAKVAREAIGGLGIQPTEVLTGKGETRAVKPEFADKWKDGSVAKITLKRASVKQAEKDAQLSGAPVDSKPAGKAEPSAEQKLAPKARYAALVAELAQLMATAPVTEPTKREPFGKSVINALNKFDTILK